GCGDRHAPLDLHRAQHIFGSRSLEGARLHRLARRQPLRVPNELCVNVHAHVGVPIGNQGTNSPPTFSNGNIYIGRYDGRVYAFDATTGTQLWSARVNNPRLNNPLNFAPAVSRDRVFVSGNLGVYAFPTNCGTPCAPLWIARTQFSPDAAPAVADGFVLVGDYQGTIYAFDWATGTLEWKGTVMAPPQA